MWFFFVFDNTLSFTISKDFLYEKHCELSTEHDDLRYILFRSTPSCNLMERIVGVWRTFEIAPECLP